MIYPFAETLLVCLKDVVKTKSVVVRGAKKAQQHISGHSGEYGNAAKLVGEMSKSVMQLIAIHFLNWF